MVTSFLSAGTVSQIMRLRQRGYATQQAITATTIQLRRRGADGTFANIGTPVPLIRIALANREPQTSGQGVQQVTTSGQALAFAPLDVRVDDRFLWGGQSCEVDSIAPVADGVVAFDFTVLEASNG